MHLHICNPCAYKFHVVCVQKCHRTFFLFVVSLLFTPILVEMTATLRLGFISSRFFLNFPINATLELRAAFFVAMCFHPQRMLTSLFTPDLLSWQCETTDKSVYRYFSWVRATFSFWYMPILATLKCLMMVTNWNGYTRLILMERPH